MILLLSFLTPSATFAGVFCFGRFIDALTKQYYANIVGTTSLYLLLGLYILLGLLSEILKRLGLTVERVVFYDWHREIILRVNSKVSTLDLKVLESPEFNTLMNKVKLGYEHIPGNFMNPLFKLISELIKLLISSIIFFTFSPLLIILILASLTPQFFVSRHSSKLQWGIWDSRGEEAKRYFSTRDNLTNIESVKEVKLFGLATYLLGNVKMIINNFITEQKQILKGEVSLSIVSELVAYISIASSYVWLVSRVFTKSILLGSFIFYMQSINEFISAGRGFLSHLMKLYEFNLFMTDLYTFLDMEPNIKSRTSATTISTDKVPTIEFKNIDFSYRDTGAKVFEDFSLLIQSGEDIALVGENGAGKTTFVKLLCRFYDVDRGEILIDGVNIKNLDLNSWHKHLGVLFQDFNRYAYSVKENIAMGNIANINSTEKITESAVTAGASEFVEQFSKKYDQILSNRFADGTDLSGGQWQRIALARAYFRDANILILDEPTSAIDAKGEYEIFKKISQVQKEKTTIIISHRFSTVRNADKIYVIEKGKVIEQGTHQELMAVALGRYKYMFELQAEGYK